MAQTTERDYFRLLIAQILGHFFRRLSSALLAGAIVAIVAIGALAGTFQFSTPQWITFNSETTPLSCVNLVEPILKRVRPARFVRAALILNETNNPLVAVFAVIIGAGPNFNLNS